MDKFMSRFITFGGLSVILAVLLIMVFIGMEVVPLMKDAKVSKVETISLPSVDSKALAVDEWTMLPGLVTKDSIYFIDLKNDNKVKREEFQRAGDSQITAVSYNQEGQTVVVGNSQGQFSVIKLNYQKQFLDEYKDGKRLSNIIYKLEQLPYMSISEKPGKIVNIQYVETDEKKLAVAIVEIDGKNELICVTLKQEVDLFGNTSGELTVGERLKPYQRYRR